MLGRVGGSIYESGADVTLATIVFLVFFWLIVGQILFGIGTGLWKRCITVGSLRWRIMAAIVLIVLLVATIAYVVSWRFYFKAARFANFESVQFALSNAHMVSEYIKSAERNELWLTSAVAILLLALAPFAARWVLRSRWSEGHGPPAERVVRMVWYSFVVCVLGLLLGSAIRRVHYNRNSLLFSYANRMNPAVTMLASVLETLSFEPIPLALSFEELTPRSATWSAPENPTRIKSPSIVFVVLDAMRHDIIGLIQSGHEVTPNVNALARNSLVLTRAYSNSNHSDYADTVVPSGMYPLRTREHHYFERTDPWPRTLIYELLHAGGYKTAMISSQNEEWGGMAHFLESPGLDYFYHPEVAGAPTKVDELDEVFANAVRSGQLRAGKFDDAHTASMAIKWIREQSETNQSFFAYVVFQNSHFPFPVPNGFERPFEPADFDSRSVSLIAYPLEQTPMVRNAYLNALHYSDHQLGRLVSCLKEQGILNDTILVVMGDHGQAFHEAGCVGHGCRPIDPTCRIACVIHSPDRLKPHVSDYPFEAVDLGPTLLGLLGWRPHPNFQGIDILSPHRPPMDERLVFVHVDTPLGKFDCVLLGGRWKLIRNRDTSEETLADLVENPAENENVAAANPEIAKRLSQILSAWRARQLAYYHYPMYYLDYYPPLAPAWNELPALPSK